MNIKDLAQALQALSVEFSDGTEEITHATAIEDGDAGAISFIGNPHYEKFLTTTKATAVIVSEYLSVPQIDGKKWPALIRTKSPYESFARALEIFSPKHEIMARGIHSTAAISNSAKVDPSASIGAHVYIGDRTVIGANTFVLPGAVIASDVEIGNDCVIHPNAVIYDHVQMGNCVIIGAGTVVGYDGFGYVPMGDGSYRKIPQVGIVVIEDNVEIGANCTIDRATVSETRICKGAKLDNLIQVGHNVEIGRNTVMAAQSGIAGSSKLGAQNIIAGQAGITGHIETTAGVIVGAQSGVSKSITKAGTYFGYPAKNHREALKLEGALRSLPELIERVKKLEEQLKETI